MSYLNLLSKQHAPNKEENAYKPGMRKAFSEWIIKNYGQDYLKTLRSQRRKKLKGLTSTKGDSPLVGIVGGGFAGMYAGLILQSLGYEFEIFESTDRVGGRIKTWYSKNYNANIKNKSGLYGEVGGMRLPQFAPDMLPVQHLALCVNAVLEKNKQKSKKVFWRKFYYNSPVQRLRFNNMPEPIISKDSATNTLNFNVKQKGDVPDVWLKQVTIKNNTFVPANVIMDVVNSKFIKEINNDFEKGFTLLMQFDKYSMWDYLANVFTLKDLNEYYFIELGQPSDNLPWSVVSYLETTNVGTGMFSVSFIEMVLAAYDWGGSKDPYRPSDTSVYMLTVDKGMQHLPDACMEVLNYKSGVTTHEGHIAQIQLGMIAGPDGNTSYSPPNLTKDAQPLPPETGLSDAPTLPQFSEEVTAFVEGHKKRVYLNHKVVELKYAADEEQMKMKVLNEKGKIMEKNYPFVISTLPLGQYLSGYPQLNLLNDLSFKKAQAIRECNYMASFKAFLTFKKQFWIELGERQGYDKNKGFGAATTDRPNRQIIYPSYGYEASAGVLQIYCWAEDARRLGALSDEERVNECLKGIAYLYPDGNVFENFAGYKPEITTKTWFWDANAGGGAFAMFNPSQFNNIYPTLLTPEFDGHLNFAGEACSVHHGWIVGALDSAYSAVLNVLEKIGDTKGITNMQATWGTHVYPDVNDTPKKKKAK